MLDDTGNEIKITYEEARLYVELKLNSKTDKREVKHDKKIYLRKIQQ